MCDTFYILQITTQVEIEESLEDEINSQASNVKNSRGLIKESITLPYYKISRPEFQEFTCNAAKNLEVPMKK